MVLEVSQETHLFFEQLTEACNLTLEVDDPATFFPRLYKFCEQILYFKDALDNLNRMFLDDREQCVLLEKKAVVLLDCATRATIDYMRSIGKHEQAAMFEIQLVEYKFAYKGVISVFIFFAYGNLKKAWEDLTDALKCQPFEQLEKFKSKLSSVFDDIEAEYHYFRRIQVTREWYSFSRLATFATIYNPKFYNQNREILAKEGRLLEAKILDIRSDALGKIIDPDGDPVVYADNFKIGVYKSYVRDIYSYIKCSLPKKIKENISTKLTHKKTIQGVFFCYAGKEVVFRPGTKRAILATELYCKNNASLSEKGVYAALTGEEVSGTLSSIEQGVVANAVKDFNKVFCTELGIKTAIKTRIKKTDTSRKKIIFANSKYI